MTISFYAYQEYAHEHGLELYQVPGGFGVRFRDGYDVYWVLPEEKWHFLNNTSALLEITHFNELDMRRERAVDAIRRYLAEQEVAIDRKPNGHWLCVRGAMSSEFSVGANLTRTLTSEFDLVTAVRSVFENSFIRGPSVRRTERHLSEFGEVLEEVPWPLEEETLISLPETPLTALGWMGLCKAIKNESSFESPQTFIAAAEPKGRIGRALLRIAQRLPNTKASVELCDGSMCIKFSDEYDSFKIAPKSRKLRDLLHSMEPEQAGDHLADEYERLNSSRRRALNAVFETLNRHGYFMDTNIVLEGLEPKKHVGRGVREFAVELGESLTKAIEKSGERCAIRHVLDAAEALVDEAVSLLGTSDGDVQLPERSLNPSVPPKVELPDLSAEQIAMLDERSDLLLSKFMGTIEALTAYNNPLMWDANADTWADHGQWQELARKHVGGDYPRCDAEMILIDHGDSEMRDRFIARLKETEPHHEVWDQEVEMVWRLRKEMPELAERWFAPKKHEDMPFAEMRARLGDAVAVCYLLCGISNNDEHEIVPSVLTNTPPALVPIFFESSQIEKWRHSAIRWANETWNWNWGGENEVLAVAANMGWPEVCDRLAFNPFLIPSLLESSEHDPCVLFADSLFLAWSKLAPSPFLMKLVGHVLSMNLDGVSETLARRCIGSVDLVKEHPNMAGEISGAWLGKIGVALAISWRRCRTRI